MNIIQLIALLIAIGVILAVIGDFLGHLYGGPDNRD